MSGYLYFPTSKDELAESLEEATAASLAEQSVQSVEWWVNHLYLQGARRIYVKNWSTGEVQATYENEQGELQFRYEALLQQYRTELGRILRMNVDPAVDREGYGLDAVRNSGVAQAILSYMVSRVGPTGKKAILSRFGQALLKYGTAGLLHYRCQGTNIGDRTCVEVVPPWELLPLPANVESLDDLRGLVRRQMVPYNWVQTLGLDLGNDETELDVKELPYGSMPTGAGPETYADYIWEGGSWKERRASQFSKSRRRSEKKDPEHQKWVTLEEVWLFGPQDTLARYIVKVGMRIGMDEPYYDYKTGKMLERVVCPLAVGRYIPTGRFWGRSFVGPLLGLNYEVEKMLGNQFQVVSDMESHGMLVIPTTSGITKRQIRKKERRKVVFAEPDPVSPNSEVTQIAPFNPGDFPAKIAGLGVDLQDKLAGQSELYGGDAPGRVDSASALGFLHEVGNINLVATLNEIAEAFTQVYSSMLQTAHREAAGEVEEGEAPSTDRGFKIPILDDRMIGVVVDPVSGEVSLDNNPVPQPWEVSIDVRERNPKSVSQMKQEAGAMLKAGIITPLDFRILNEREGLGFPVVSRGDWEAYRKATVQKILLFNDGESPGTVIGGVEYDRPDIMLMVLGEFMTSIEFSVASPEVKNAFIEMKNAYGQLLGKFPEQLQGVDQMGPPGEKRNGRGQGPQPGPGRPGAGAGAGRLGGRAAPGLTG
jgi:hypothetical protein